MNDTATATHLNTLSATYSPEDNKLRLYAVSRLDADLYKRVRDAGFIWAPKQGLFVAPMWTPERAALLMELCGEIGDEDTSLVERAEERADRFEEYSAKRAADASAARDAVARIADGIPLGQPILVGHHSEKRARKDAERIRTGMRKAVDMWETSAYWVARAKGALSHAKYKERPDVRHRRIKGLEADKRKQLREIEESERYIRMWNKPDLTDEQAKTIANYDRTLPFGTWGKLDDGEMHAVEAAALALDAHVPRLERARAWVAHIDNRLAYERAMLDEQGAPAERFPIEVGGRVLSDHWRGRGSWLVVTKINKDATGAIGSVSTTAGVIEIEAVAGYRAPEAGAVEAVKASKKLAPLVNYPGEGFLHMTSAEYKTRAKHSDSYHVRPIKASDKYGAHRLRHGFKPGSGWDLCGVYLTDAKRVDPPAPAPTAARAEVLAPEPTLPAPRAPRPAPERTEFDDMKDALRDGVAVVAVSAPELFPTPAPLAARMVRLAGVTMGWRVLEPSAGTGNIVRELAKVDAAITAVEIDPRLAAALQHPRHNVTVIADDFLSVSGLGSFDAVVMNPPFSAEIEHVRHAFEMLHEGGTLVSVMSAGVKFRSDKRSIEFREFVEAQHGEMEDLPEDSFAASGTSVRTVLVTLRR